VKLLQQLSQEQESIVMVEVESIGPGSAREVGRKYCVSEFIAFWDCDDLPNTGEILKKISILSPSTDVLVGGFSRYDFLSHRIYDQRPPIDIYSILHTPGIWRMVFRSKSIAALHFPNLRMAEDHVFLAQLVSSNLCIEYSTKNFYRYTVGRINQLSKNSIALLEIPLAVSAIAELFAGTSLQEKEKEFLYAVYLNLSLSHALRTKDTSQILASLNRIIGGEMTESRLAGKAMIRVLKMKFAHKWTMR
jgi:glycosyltransferase involved in cell wall biosynthesis